MRPRIDREVKSAARNRLRHHPESRLALKLLLTHLAAALLASVAAVSFLDRGPGSLLGWIAGLGALAFVGRGVGALRRTLSAVRSLTRAVTKLGEGLEADLAEGTAQARLEQERLDDAFWSAADEETARLAAALDRLGSRQRRRVEQLALERATLEAVLQSLADPVVAVDASLRVVFANRPARELFSLGERKGEALAHGGRHAIEVVRDHECVAMLQRAIAGGVGEFGTLRLGVSPADARTYRVAVSPIRGAGPSVSGAVCVLHDQTELMRLERIRSDFVANVSHELRTPLTAVHGFIETLQDGSYRDSERVLRYLEIMHGETTRLIALINDLLHLSRLEGPAGALARERADLADVAHEVGELVRKRAEAKGLEWRVATVRPLPQVAGDGASIRQALLNLVDNAVKYTEAGGAVTVLVTPDDSGVRVTVSDTGVGIPKDALPRVFERFYRVDKARSRKEGGTGLGLSIVKHTVERHQGRLGIESEVGVGTTIWFWLPGAGSAGPH